jgi:hypothetical protein
MGRTTVLEGRGNGNVHLPGRCGHLRPIRKAKQPFTEYCGRHACNRED